MASLFVPNFTWIAGTAAAVASVTYVTQISDTSDATVYTFTSANIGTAAADRVVVVAPGGEQSNVAASISSVTLGGNAMTEAVQLQNNNRGISGIYYLAVAAGTSADIVVTYSATSARCSIAIWNLNGLTSSTPYDTDSVGTNTGTTLTLTGLDFPNNGVGICSLAAGDVRTVDWTNASERYETTTSENLTTFSGADLTQATATTTLDITATVSSTLTQGSVLVGASWS